MFRLNLREKISCRYLNLSQSICLTALLWGAVVLFAIALLNPSVPAQTAISDSRAMAANVVVPQLGAFSAGTATKPEVTGVEAGVVIREQSAVTTLDIALHNPSSRRTEAELWIPIPEGAVIQRLQVRPLRKRRADSH